MTKPRGKDHPHHVEDKRGIGFKICFDLTSIVLQMTGMRSRLRCPHCRRVGTFKPHGSIFDRVQGDRRAVRRWLCKWCGYYQGPEGIRQAAINTREREWQLTEWGEIEYKATTPEVAFKETSVGGSNPWGG